MDVNQTLTWLAAEREEFDLARDVAWSSRRRAVALAPAEEVRLPARDVAFARAAAAAARPRALDGFAQLAFLSADRRTLRCDAGGTAGATSAGADVLDEELAPVVAPAGAFVDLAVGAGSRVALPWHDAAEGASGLVAFDLRRRIVERCPLPVEPRRALVLPDRSIVVGAERELLRVAGESLPQPYRPRPARFEPSRVTPRPLQLEAQVALRPDLHLLALAHDGTSLHLLCHDDVDATWLLARRLDAAHDAPFRERRLAASLPFAVDLAAVARGRLALLVPRRPAEAAARRDALVVDVPEDAAPHVLVRRRHPMRELADARFVAGFDGVPRYPATSDAALGRVRPAGVRELVALPLPRRARSGLVRVKRPFDSGVQDCVWHRLYLDASIPPATALRVRAAASERDERPPDHHFELQPPPVWNPLPSEAPFAEGVAPAERDASGLFELLLQRENGRVRRLQGRFLWLEVELSGDGRATPRLHALRASGPRFCWQERYLPELFHQSEPVAEPPRSREARAGAPREEPNGADFRERWLACFEGMATPIEGRIAAAEQLLDPAAAPAHALPFLASFVGRPLDPSWPVARQRRAVAAAGELARWRGTLLGVRLALDVATDGLVARGAIVVIENFRLRRTMATLLGIDLDDHDHPLTLGTMVSGNSIVGDSLLLAEETARAFLSLWAPESLAADERTAAMRFLELHAHKVTVLLHGPARERVAMVERVLEQELPAHLACSVFPVERSFVAGLAPLLAVDTWVEHEPPPRGVVLNDTHLTREGLLLDLAAFAPAAANAHPARRRPREEP